MKFNARISHKLYEKTSSSFFGSAAPLWIPNKKNSHNTRVLCNWRAKVGRDTIKPCSASESPVLCVFNISLYGFYVRILHNNKADIGQSFYGRAITWKTIH